MKFRVHCLAAIALALIASGTFAQTSFSEVEPNSQKSEATVVNGMVAGDTINGKSTGSTTTLGNTTVGSVDVYRVKTGALALGIYRHRLTLTTTGAAGHTGTLRGLTQNWSTPGQTGTVSTIDTQFQISSTSTTPARFNQWYGFGKQEQVYYRVSGASTTTAAYVSTLTTTTVAPTVIAGSFVPGVITITTVGQTTENTEIHLYDANLDAIPGGLNDDTYLHPEAVTSTLTRCLAPGTYFVAVSGFNTSNNLPTAADDNISGPVMDFPGSLVRHNSSTVAADWDFTVSDSSTTTTVTNQLPAGEPYGIRWATFTVATPSIPSNDSCASAQVIGTGIAGINLVSATNDGAATCDPGGISSKDVWYSFTNTIGYPSRLALNTCGSSGIDTVVTVFTSCGGSELACSDDCGGSPCSGPTSCTSLALAVSQTVVIRVSDKGLGGGCFLLNVSNTLLNDECATPTALPGPGVYPIDNSLATTGTQGQSELVCSFSSYTAIRSDVWYTYTATMDGTATVSTCGLVPVPPGTGRDSKIAIYIGAGCPTLAAFACNDDAGTGAGSPTACASPNDTNSTINFPVSCGVTFTIQIGMNALSLGRLLGQFSVLEAGLPCDTPFTSYCSGDGSDTTCPCANPGLAGRGCENTFGTGGASISSTGIASISNDTLVLHAANTGPLQFGLYFEGSATANPTAPFGVVFGNGIRCVNFAGANRLEIRQADAVGSSSTSVALSIPGFAVAGTTYYYQLWYRDGVPPTVLGTCNPTAGFNFSHALSLTWGL